ncbi:glycosyltransferase family 39 protein [Actinoplanes derwentensis]|uniref:glycosyltransferase family 39 protein n=1 Tax=Actinoplanes derwentensis TaxID=113562 RepID=UPI0012FD4215|nr:glycosyltransferase family 39 protein [Actinoplanes derwentensis]
MSAHAVRVLVWLLPPLVTAGLGAWRLDRAALWADELATWGAVRLDWDRLWLLAGAVDAVITPYYAALKVLDPVDLRLPSLVATVLTSVVIVALGRRVGGDPVGLTAGMFYAVLPVTSRYAQEARPYAGTVLFAALALLALLRLLDRPTRSRAAAYAAAVAVTGLCHPLSGLLMIVGHAPAGRRAWRMWPAAALIGAVPAIGLGVAASGQTGQVAWIGRVSLNNLYLVPDQFFISGVTGGLLLALAVAGIAIGMAKTETGRARPVLALAGAGLLPPALLLAAGTVAGVWVARYVLFVLPALVTLAAVAAIRAGRLPAAASVALIAVLGWPAQADIRESAGHGQASDRIAGVIGPLHRDGDVVVFPDTHPSMPWVARDIYERYVPQPRPPDVLAVSPQRADGRLAARECADLPGCLGVPPRIWIVRPDNNPDPLHDMSPAKRTLISAGYQLRDRWDFRQLSVILMERRA